MTRLFTEGWEMGDTLIINSTGSGAQGIVATPRSGTYSYRTTMWGIYQGWAIMSVPDTSGEFYFRTGWLSNGTNHGSSEAILKFLNAGTQIFALSFAMPNLLQVWVGGSSIYNSTSVVPMTTNQWYLLEVYLKIADSGGRITIKAEGVQVFDYTGDTKPGSNTSVNQIYMGGNGEGNGVGSFWDDIAINDTAGLVDNSWCGDGRIISLVPNGNGDVNQFTGSDGNSTDNYLLVDETPSNSDTDYVEASVSGYQDMYNVTNFDNSAGQTIQRIWVESRARDTVANGGQIKLGIKTNGTVVLDPTPFSLLTTYTITQKTIQWFSNPVTSGSWSDTDLDAIQLVVEAE